MENNNEVYIVESTFEKYSVSENGEKITEIDKEVNAVFSTYDGAEKFGKWLLAQEGNEEMKYIDYEISNFLVL